MKIPLHQLVIAQFLFQDMRNPVLGAAGSDGREEGTEGVIFQVAGEVVGKEALQRGMESRSVIGVLQVREFVEKDVILQGFGHPHEIEVQVDVSLRRAGAPI